MSLSDIATQLSIVYNIPFQAEENIDQKYNVTLPNADFEALRKKLQDDYGIQLVEKKQTAEYLVLKPEKE